MNTYVRLTYKDGSDALGTFAIKLLDGRFNLRSQITQAEELLKEENRASEGYTGFRIFKAPDLRGEYEHNIFIR